MKWLIRTFRFKIGVTLLLWFLVPLFVPQSCLKTCVGIPEMDSTFIFIRLLGMAYGALLVGYVFGLRDAQDGIYPERAVWVGIVSNGGAFLILLIGAVQGIWSSSAWGGWAKGFMWFSLGATFAISAGLIAFGPRSSHRKSESQN